MARSPMKSPLCGWLPGDVTECCWPGSFSPDTHAHAHTLLVNRESHIPHILKGINWSPVPIRAGSSAQTAHWPQAPSQGCPLTSIPYGPSPGFLNQRDFKIAASSINNAGSREDALHVGGARPPGTAAGPGPMAGPWVFFCLWVERPALWLIW